MLFCKNISGNLFFIFFLLSLINIPTIVYSKMYLWKDEKGVFNASEEKPGWWPREQDCIAWVPDKRRKVVDLVKTRDNMTTCELDIKEKKEQVKKIVKKKIDEGPAPKKEIMEPTDKEERIYCAYRKGLMQFLDASDPEKVSTYHVSKKFGIPEEELNGIFSKVMDYKGGDYKCVY
ncbi:MAG: hypothetical protein D3925_11960 [Candidatus Electrothrix sp. AR5]|nr:hypothetical protein [Candidatus Electrothrix sp. AR5]